jgi:hypothetical protein
MTKDPLPELPGGFEMALPGEIHASGDRATLLKAEPSTSRLVIYGDPSNQDDMRRIQIIGLQEDLLHLDRQRSGIEKNIHLLQQETWSALNTLLRDEIDIETAAEKIALKRSIWNTLRHEATVIENIDKYLKYSVLDDLDYLNDRIEEYSARRDVDFETVLERTREDIQYLRQHGLDQYDLPDWVPDLGVDRQLRRIGDQYGYGVAQAVTDVAIDLPYLIEPLDYGGYPSVNVSDVSIGNRLEASIETLGQLDDPTELLENEELHDHLQHALDDPALNESDPASLGGTEDLPVDLIQKPLDVGDVERAPEDREPIDLSEIGQCLASAVGPLGNVGGVVYPLAHEHDDYPLAHDEDDQEVTPTGWLVNPRIADDPVWNGWTYKQLWEWGFLMEELLYDLDEIARPYVESSQAFDRQTLKSKLQSADIQCSLCTVSPPGQYCGEGSCACESYVSATRERLPELVAELVTVYDEIGMPESGTGSK